MRPRLFAIAMTAALWAQPSFAQPIIPYLDPDAIERGATLYQDQCAACHGAKLEGQPNWRQRDDDGRLPAPPHDVTGHTWHHSDLLLFQITKYGTSAVVGDGYQSNMSAFEDQLTDAQILETLAYIKSRWPDQAQRVQNSRNQ